jgi:molybdopterin molybdotransferase
MAVISTGNELVSADDVPNDYQIRKSNSYTIVAALSPYQLFPDVYHFDDDKDEMQERITQLVSRYDVIILSGAVSMGKFDYLPEAMEQAGITKLFHKVQQRPGKPFWLGRHPNGAIAFALPGNPVSTFMCLYRYFMPWLFKCYHLTISPVGCILETDVIFEPTLEYFMQVNVKPNENGQLIAKPLQGNGSGDLGNLVVANGFMQLPAYQNKFDAGAVYPVWIFKAIA